MDINTDHPPRCASCGFDLTGHAVPTRCPECGVAIVGTSVKPRLNAEAELIRRHAAFHRRTCLPSAAIALAAFCILVATQTADLSLGQSALLILIAAAGALLAAAGLSGEAWFTAPLIPAMTLQTFTLILLTICLMALLTPISIEAWIAPIFAYFVAFRWMYGAFEGDDEPDPDDTDASEAGFQRLLAFAWMPFAVWALFPRQ